MDGRDLVTRAEAAVMGCDRRKIASRVCIMCGKAIGRKPALGWTIFARFGTMLWLHRRCVMEERVGHARSSEQKKPVRRRR